MSLLLVFPVGRNAVFGHLMHLGGADLHLDRPMTADHGRVQRLVAIGLGQADVILEATGDGAKGVVNHRKSAITALEVGHQDAQGRHIEDFVEGLLLQLHLAPDAIEVLGPSAHFAVVQPCRLEPLHQQAHRGGEALLTVAALAGHLLLDLPVGLGLENLEGEVLELPLEAADAEPVGEGA